MRNTMGRKKDPRTDSLYRRAAELRAHGHTYAEIGRNLGMTRQGATKLLNSTGSPRVPFAIRCSSCTAAFAQGYHTMKLNGDVLCIDCLRSSPEASFSQRLKTFRLAAGLSQHELAHRLGVQPLRISVLERGLYTPRWEQLLRLVEILGPELVTLGRPDQRNGHSCGG
jgi:transcriptional regulator with XRE-family HTH domain